MATRQAPWAENAAKVVVEFQKSTQGAGRKILLKHNAQALPQQLFGRVDPAVWAAFMTDVEQLALEHPYTANPSADQCCTNLAGCFCFVTLGFGIFQGDGGDYNVWLSQCHQVVDKHRPFFAPGACQLSMQRVHGNYWIQVDINLNVAPAVVMGQPVPMSVPVGQVPAGTMQQPMYPPIGASGEYTPETKPASKQL